MGQYVSTNSMIPLRLGPSHNSEMGSQILFGELYDIVDKAGSWVKIKLIFDNYEGWLDTDHFLPTDFKSQLNSYIVRRESVVINHCNEKMVIYPGSEVYNYNKEDGSFELGGKKYISKNLCVGTRAIESIIDTALSFLNAPYLWGGRTGHGLDCSGLSQICYKIHNKNIPRNSFNQAYIGETINLLNDAKDGDLLFFDNAQGNINHVGILYGSSKVIHASGVVRIDKVDHQGIFKDEFGRYSHKLRLIKRI